MNQDETAQLTDDIETVVWNASNQIEVDRSTRFHSGQHSRLH